MILPVLKFPNKKLREKAKPVKQVTSSIQDLVQSLFETMHASNGIGLAATQVGEALRVIVIDVPKVDPIDPEKIQADPLALINPIVESGEGQIQFEEGCLSCPELIVTVDRLAKVKVSYLDLNGRPCEIRARDLKGVCIQHEIDHLEGILLVDKLKRADRDLYRQKRLRVARNEKEVAQIL